MSTAESAKDFTVIGGGIVGLATAWKLARARPDARIRVVEKEEEVSRHQSGNNSGVLHCGLYYKPGSLKAKLAVSGIREMTEFCRRNGIAHEICGKLVVATDDAERKRLDTLEERGKANGLRGIRRLDREGIRQREPHSAGVEALEVPEEGIVDYPAVCRELASELRADGHRVDTGMEVVALDPNADGGWDVITKAGGEIRRADFVVNCGGLHSDRICKMAGGSPKEKIIPFRGEYYTIKKDRQHLVRHLIYPVPDPKFPFLGVHFTRLIHGGIECGPNAVLAFSREGYRKRDISVRDLADAAFFPGLWRFALRYPTMCLRELWQSFSRRSFTKALRKLVPEIRPSDLERGGAGVRAQAMNRTGGLVEDFAFASAPGILHVLNAPSPAATASLAIAGEIVGRILPSAPTNSTLETTA